MTVQADPTGTESVATNGPVPSDDTTIVGCGCGCVFYGGAWTRCLAHGGGIKLAYADPPYLGCCKLYDHHHPDGPMPWDGRCWDDPETHRLLLAHLASEYDGFAYSCTSTSLATLLPLAPGTRVGAWVKPFAAFKRNVRIAYTWEPVLFVPGRDRSKDGAPVGRDHIAEPITLRKGFTGTKPERVCRWLLDLLGYVEGDQVDDLFPGAGPMGRVLNEIRIPSSEAAS